MNRKFALGIAAMALAGGVAFAGPASAAGLKGASYCSGASGPDGIVTEDPATWNSPGEVISVFTPQGEFASSGSPAGQEVKAICNPNLNPLP